MCMCLSVSLSVCQPVCLSVCSVCVCRGEERENACVCVREREREREKKRGKVGGEKPLQRDEAFLSKGILDVGLSPSRFTMGKMTRFSLPTLLSSV